jgi:hypothetical protein
VHHQAHLQAFRRKSSNPCAFQYFNIAKTNAFAPVSAFFTGDDLVRDGRALKSTGHTDLKTCPGLRKSVSFDVVPGRYIVQLTNAPETSVKMAAVMR